MWLKFHQNWRYLIFQGGRRPLLLGPGMAPRGVGVTPQCCRLSWSNPDWVGPSKMANANILFNKRIRVGQTSTLTDSSWPYLNIDWFELVKPQHWPTRVIQTSTLTVSSWPNLNTDRLELVKPQHWPTRVVQTSTLTVLSWPNLNTDRLELVKPQHWPTRVGQTSTLTDSSWSNLNNDRLELVKLQHRSTRVGQICFHPPPPPITYPWSHPWLGPTMIEKSWNYRNLPYLVANSYWFNFIKIRSTWIFRGAETPY